MSLGTSTIAIAEVNIEEKLKLWYLERLKTVESYLTESTSSEADLQKAELLRLIRKDTEDSVNEIKDYALSKEHEINNKIEAKMKETANKLNSDSEAELKKAKQEIDNDTSKKIEQIDKQEKNEETKPKEDEAKVENNESSK